jgi:hypothetical protein
MSCEAELDALNQSWEAVKSQLDAMADEQERLNNAVEQFNSICGYYDGNGQFVIDPLEPGDPDFPEGGPTCPEAFNEWLDSYLDWLPEKRKLDDLNEERGRRAKDWVDCRHESKHHLLA